MLNKKNQISKYIAMYEVLSKPNTLTEHKTELKHYPLFKVCICICIFKYISTYTHKSI